MLVAAYFPLCLWSGRCVVTHVVLILFPMSICLSRCVGSFAMKTIKKRRNVFLYPVLKHGPRSPTSVRVQGCYTQVHNESDRGWTILWHNPPASILWENGLSVSINVGTRKMVNYA